MMNWAARVIAAISLIVSIARADDGVELKHWAFQPVRAPSPPEVTDANRDWALDPVDRFILAKLEQAKLKPAADANRHTWIRRVSFDLTGLPPAPEDIGRFVADESPRAFERVVDRLLHSRAFGERWARHWLDLTGYADQIGTSNDVFAEHAWRYRDYLIEACNTDKPFDQFIREQIAGDLLPFHSPGERADNLIATGFLVLGDVEIVKTDKLAMEVELVDQQLSKVGGAFLGMTLGCARCHDHKFDPIAEEDYYALAGIFRSTDSTHMTKRGVWSSVNVRELPETAAQHETRIRLEREHAAKLNALQARRKTAEEQKTALNSQIENAPDEERAALEMRRDGLAKQITDIDREIEHTGFFAPSVAEAFAVRDAAEPGDMRITIRGNPRALGEKVKRGVPRVACWEEFPPIPANESGRVQLADWIADSRNPLTARVAVNRIWQTLFGEGLVRSVDYFGTRGETPTHPGLLDHLAERFVRGGWSRKKLIRALVLSRAYQMSSGHDNVAMSKDPENRLLWRMNRQRLDAEAIRDAMLAIGDTLAASNGGPALPLEYAINVNNLNPGNVNPPSFALRKFRPEQEFERTVYLPIIRSGGQPGPAKLRDLFDFTQPAQMAGKRAETAVPTQALFLINSGFLRSRATELATHLAQGSPDTGSRLKALWLRTLNRPITASEHEKALAFLDGLRPLTGDDGELAPWIELSHALLASNEFLHRL